MYSKIKISSCIWLLVNTKHTAWYKIKYFVSALICMCSSLFLDSDSNYSWLGRELDYNRGWWVRHVSGQWWLLCQDWLSHVYHRWYKMVHIPVSRWARNTSAIWHSSYVTEAITKLRRLAWYCNAQSAVSLE
jgi:hypothetical protein